MTCKIYLEKPEGFEPKFETAACFIMFQNEILFLRRLESKPFGDTLCLPGGKLDPDEKPLDAVLRETHEETKYNLPEDLPEPKTVYVNNSGVCYLFHMFKYQIEERFEPQLRPTEHSGYEWSPMEQTKNLNLIPGQRECIDIMFNN